MKNFDIEKLERKMPYSIPEDFFTEMQANVLAKTVQASPIISENNTAVLKKNNWMYAAAAAIAGIFGTTYVMNQNNAPAEKNTLQTPASIATASDPVVQKEAENTIAVAEKAETPAPEEHKALETDLTSSEVSHPKTESRKSAVNNIAKSNIVTPEIKTEPIAKNTTPKLEEILEEMPETALAELGKNTEQDIYLDLYN